MLNGDTGTGSVHDRIERYLLRQIESGLLKPGDRLPPSSELAAALNAHPITVHKALHRLKNAGLVDRTPRLGTFVRRGREEFRIAVAFGPSLTNENTYFYRALLRAMQDDPTLPRCQCLPYDGISHAARAEDLANCFGFSRFRSDHGDRPFSGLVGVGLADEHWDQFRRHAPDLAWARMGLGGEVHPDMYHFGYTSAAYLLAKGARRLIYLRTLSPSTGEDVRGASEAVAAYPDATLTMKQLPARGSYYDESRDAALCANLAAEWDCNGPWPDAILISDDVTMRGLAHALLAHGLERVESIRVLSWSNRGIRLHYGFPVVRYEVDLADFARALLTLVKNRSEGRSELPTGMAVRGRIIEPEGAALEMEESAQAIGRPGEGGA